VSCALAQSGPQDKQKTAENKTESDATQIGTQTRPVVVQPLPVVPTEQQSAQEAADRAEKRDADKWTFRLAMLTVGVGLLQAFIYWKQARSLERTIAKMDEIAKGQTTDMGKYITEAARSATAMEGIAKATKNNTYLQMRARLGLQAVKAVIEMGPNKELLFSLTFRNFGGKGAFVTEQFIRMGIDPLPSIPDYSTAQFEPIGLPIEAGDAYTLTAMLTHFTPEEWSQLTNEAGMVRFKILGEIRYNLGFNRTARLGFCREYDPKLSRLSGKVMFPTAGGKAYNYAE
jgi:hypothetical protein